MNSFAKVIDSEEYGWMLYSLRGELYLLCLMQNSGVDYYRLVKITPQEVGEYNRRGRLFITELASKISYSPTSFKDRAIYGDDLNWAVDLAKSHGV